MTITTSIANKIVQYVREFGIRIDYTLISDYCPRCEICFMTGMGRFCWVYCYPDRITVQRPSYHKQFPYCDPEYWNKLCDCLQYCIKVLD